MIAVLYYDVHLTIHLWTLVTPSSIVVCLSDSGQRGVDSGQRGVRIRQLRPQLRLDKELFHSEELVTLRRSAKCDVKNF